MLQLGIMFDGNKCVEFSYECLVRVILQKYDLKFK
jgi:hypothetical protein